MGAWGYKLYECDDATGFREEFRAVKDFPFSEDQFLSHFQDGCGYLKSEDQTIQWLVLYDQFHQYAIEAPKTFQRVRDIIESGEDIAYHRELAMSSGDLVKRAKHLQSLWQRWQTPLTKAKKRKLVDPDQPFVMDVGDVYIYPTENEWPRMPSSWRDEIEGLAGQAFNLTGWTAFVVLKRQKTAGVIPQYVVLRLKLQSGSKRPDIEDIKSAFVAGETDNTHLFNAENHLGIRLQIYYVETTAQDLKYLRAEHLGRLSIDVDVLLHDMEKFSAEQFWRWKHLLYLEYQKEGENWPGEKPGSEPYIDGVYDPAEMRLVYRKSLKIFLCAGETPAKASWRKNIVPVKALPLKNYLSEAKPAKRTERYFTIDDLRQP